MVLNLTQKLTVVQALRVALDEILSRNLESHLDSCIAPTKVTHYQVIQFVQENKDFVQQLVKDVQIPPNVKQTWLKLADFAKKIKLESKETQDESKRKVVIPDGIMEPLSKIPNYNPITVVDVRLYNEVLNKMKVEPPGSSFLILIREAYLEMTPLHQYRFGEQYPLFHFRIGTVPFNLDRFGKNPEPKEISQEVEVYVKHRVELHEDHQQVLMEQKKALEGKMEEKQKHILKIQEELKQHEIAFQEQLKELENLSEADKAKKQITELHEMELKMHQTKIAYLEDEIKHNQAKTEKMIHEHALERLKWSQERRQLLEIVDTMFQDVSGLQSKFRTIQNMFAEPLTQSDELNRMGEGSSTVEGSANHSRSELDESEANAGSPSSITKNLSSEAKFPSLSDLSSSSPPLTPSQSYTSSRLSSSHSKLYADFIEDVTIPDDSEQECGKMIHKVWKVKNTGTLAWPRGSVLVAIPPLQSTSNYKDFPDANYPRSAPVSNPEASVVTEVAIDLKVPDLPGLYQKCFQLQSPMGVLFGQPLWIQITAVEKKKINNF